MDSILYSGTEQRLRNAVRSFVTRRVTPVASSYDASGCVPDVVYRSFFHQGWLHGYVPKAQGGLGHSLVETTVVAEELAFGCCAIAAALVTPILPISMILHAGTSAQKERFLGPLSQRFSLPALACTETETGSDLRSTRTIARRQGDVYVIAGEKAYVSNLPFADFVVVLARTEPGEGQGSTRALTAFILPRETAGIVIGERLRTSGLRSMAVCPLMLEDVTVPEDLRLGAEGDGLKLLNAGLNLSRTTMASFGVGGCRRTVAEVLEYARRRQLFGGKLLRQQDYRFRLVAMEEAIATAKLLTWLAACKYDAGQGNTREASMAKMHSGRVSREISAEAHGMFGGRGYLSGSAVEKFYREAPAIGLIEGPEPIQSEIIFSEMLRHGLY
jgi:acyl-CoA dehydrogenase